MFCIYLRTNSDLCHLQHKLVGFYNPGKERLLRGTDRIFNSDSYNFVFKRLQDSYMFRLFKIAIIEVCIKEIRYIIFTAAINSYF